MVSPITPPPTTITSQTERTGREEVLTVLTAQTPFAGMTRSRFNGRRPQPPSQPGAPGLPCQHSLTADGGAWVGARKQEQGGDRLRDRQQREQEGGARHRSSSAVLGRIGIVGAGGMRNHREDAGNNAKPELERGRDLLPEQRV